MRSVLHLLLILLFPLTVFSGEIVFGTYPSNSPENIYKAFTDITAYLAEDTGQNIRLVVTRDYSELAERLSNGTIDFAWIGSVNYVKAKKKIPSLRYIATYCERSDTQDKIIPYYQGYIISKKSLGINTISGLNGKMFAYVDKDSTSGYAYPRMMLKEMGIDDSTFFKKVFFLKKHDRVIEALVSGSIDGGAVSDGTYYNAVEKYGSLFTILEKSKPIPLDAVVASAKMPESTVQKIRAALLKVGEKHKVNGSIRKYLGWPAAGFTEKSDSFYDSLRQALDMK